MSKKNSGSASALRVFVRVRPPISQEVTEENALTAPSNSTIKLTSQKHNISCAYDHVFPQTATQEDVFHKIQSLLDDVLSGYNGCIFAYGQTSAGKTHTMLGPQGGTNLNGPKDRWGVLPRSAEYLFSQLEEHMSRGNFRYTAKASFLQIYKERLFDLLRGSGSFEGEEETGLKIREIPRLQDPVTGEIYKKDTNRPSEVFITGLSEYRVQTAADILKILAMGTANRHTRSTNFNDTSSRSHALLQINFEIESKQQDGQTLLYRSKLSLVDLAGSEKMLAMDRNDTSAHHLRELTSINKSLSCLGNVIASLTKKKRTHVPYRDSKLTRILQDSLGGNTRTILITCVAPTDLHAAESYSTLQFADRARNVMLKAKANMVIDDKALLADAQTEIARLKLLLKQALQKVEAMNEGGSTEVGEFINDGETNVELDRVLRENKKLRKENYALQKAIANLRLTGAGGGSSHDVYIRGGAGAKGRGGKKSEWKSSLVDDDVYRKPKARANSRRIMRIRDEASGREIRTSQSDPLVIPSDIQVPDEHDGDELMEEATRRSNENFSLPGIHKKSLKSQKHQQQKFSRDGQQQQYIDNQTSSELDPLKSAILEQVKNANNALQSSLMTSQKPVAIGSPSKKSMDAVRKGYNEAVHDDANEEYEDDAFDNDDNDEDMSSVDAKEFRKQLEKAKNSKQLKAVEKTLTQASKNVAKELEQDTAALNKIQSSRLELERQLKELHMAEAAERKDSSISESFSSPRNENKAVNNMTSPQSLTPSGNYISSKATNNEKSETRRPDAMSNLSSIVSTSTGRKNIESLHSSNSAASSVTKEPPSASATAQTAVKKPRTKAEVKNQHPPADLKYSLDDIGRRIELYSYKFATWDIICLVDFSETNGNMHKCVSESDKSEKWIDLKKKPIRGLRKDDADAE